MISNLTKNHASQVAALHIQGIPTGFLSSLGNNFLTILYAAIADDKNSFGFVAIQSEKVLGFVAFSTNLSKLYKHAVMKKGFRFALELGRRMLSMQVIKKVLQNVFYPSKMKNMNLPEAELLSIAIAPECRGKGIAKQLIEAGFEECLRRGIDKVKVLVAADNQSANNLYTRSGFELITQIDSHKVISNIYVKGLRNHE